MQNKHTPMDGLMRYASYLGYGKIHIKVDSKTGLRAIIAVHSTKLGPAIGGCRMIAYDNTNKALEDALRLGYMMSYKSAITGVPHGGAKAVLIRPPIIKNREAYFECFGEFVNELGGAYITAVDSGTSPAEMDIIARKTKFVMCTTAHGDAGDPSMMTMWGVKRGIEAAIKFQLGQPSVTGVHFALQGLGHVGLALAKELYRCGAKLTVTDIDETLLARFGSTYPEITICRPDEIYDVSADVFVPNALGAILNRETIKRLKVRIVAGSANNQLAHQQYGSMLLERDILYAPDFLINAGGLIYVSALYAHQTQEKAEKDINHIYDRAYEIFERSKKERVATNLIARQIAHDRLSE